MQRHHVASTLYKRHVPLGYTQQQNDKTKLRALTPEQHIHTHTSDDTRVLTTDSGSKAPTF